MRPQWFDKENVPFSIMWPDDILWFPSLLNNKLFYGYFKFRGMNDITDYTLKEVEDLDHVKIPKGPTPIIK